MAIYRHAVEKTRALLESQSIGISARDALQEPADVAGSSVDGRYGASELEWRPDTDADLFDGRAWVADYEDGLLNCMPRWASPETVM